MTRKANIDPLSRGFYYANSGNDDWDGRSFELPKKTIQAAIQSATELDPPPGLGETAIVEPAQGGDFDEACQMEDFVLVRGEDVTMIVDSLVVVGGASFSSLVGPRITNLCDSGVIFEIDGEISYRIDVPFAEALGDNSSIFGITGSCEDLFLDVAAAQVAGDDAICYKFTGTLAGKQILFSAKEISLLGLRSTAILWDPTNNIDVGVANIAATSINGIEQQSGTPRSGSQTIGLHMKGGEFTANVTSLTAGTTCIVEDGAILNLNVNDLHGDIEVQAGGELNCNINRHHSGHICNLGAINGNINGILYGTYDHEQILTFYRSGSISASFVQAGRFTLDMSKFVIDTVIATYEQTLGLAITVDFQIIDADTLDRYFEGTGSSGTAGIKSITVNPDVSIPAIGLVNFLIEYKRAGPAGVSGANTQIEYSFAP